MSQHTPTPWENNMHLNFKIEDGQRVLIYTGTNYEEMKNLQKNFERIGRDVKFWIQDSCNEVFMMTVKRWF